MSRSVAPIKEFAIGIYDGPHATPKPSDEGPIFLGIQNVTEEGRLDFSDIRHVSETEFPIWTKRVKPQKDDIVFSYEATLHRYARIPDGFEGCLGRRMALVRPDPQKVNPRFLLFYFLSPIWRAKMDAITITGATVNRIPLTTFPVTEVSIPGLNAQNAIAETLSAYDDLIENNRRRIALLEEAARMLYREWFVGFRFPGHEHARIIDGLPEGWDRKRIADTCSFLGRGISPNYDDEGGYIVINQKCIRDRLLSLAPARRQTKAYNEDRALRYLDVLINSTGTGTLGRVAQCWFEPEAITFDSHVTVARPSGEVDPFWFGYALLELQKLFEGMGDGATNQKELARGRIADTRVVTPPRPLQLQFADFAANATAQIQTLTTQNEKLAQARDLLLPRLMNGEIAV
jgi:type I restriction enzyme S subunit